MKTKKQIETAMMEGKIEKTLALAMLAEMEAQGVNTFEAPPTEVKTSLPTPQISEPPKVETRVETVVVEKEEKGTSNTVKIVLAVLAAIPPIAALIQAFL
ncbi:MAG: hypothetical protein AAGM67_03070 [Bacteroidota bacterium]